MSLWRSGLNNSREIEPSRRFVQRDSFLDVPMGPGLGVDINMEVVERYLLR